MRYTLLVLFTFLLSSYASGQFMFERGVGYIYYPVNGIGHISESLHKAINTSAAFLIYFDLDPESDRMTYSHTLAFSSTTTEDLSAIMDGIIKAYDGKMKQQAFTNGETWCVLPVTIHHQVHREWYKGLSSDFRDVPEAFATLRGHLLNTPDNVLPTFFAFRPYSWVVCHGG